LKSNEPPSVTDAALTTAELRKLTEAHLALTRYGNATKKPCLHNWAGDCPNCGRTADGWDELIDRAHQALGVIIGLAIAGRIRVVTSAAQSEVDPLSIAAMVEVIESGS
jgi:hypothetical protein